MMKKSILLYFFLFFMVSIILIFYTIITANQIELHTSIYVKDTTDIEIYFDTGSGFNEIEKINDRLLEGKINHLQFFLPGNVERIRFDPTTQPTEIEIYSLKIKRKLSDSINDLIPNCIEIRNHLKIEHFTVDTISLIAYDRDPQILLFSSCIPERMSHNKYFGLISDILLASIAITLFFCIIFLYWHQLFPRIVYVLIGITIFQSLLIILLSSYNLHPDEHAHSIASQYYKEHWTKLPVDHPDMKATLIPGWATSYLFLNDFVYFLSEKSTSFLTLWIEDDFVRYRLFNLSLLIVLFVFFSTKLSKGIYFILALGLTPQTWYIFSYFNGDAFSLFACFILGYYFIINKEKIINYFWNSERISLKIILLYFLCSLIFLVRLHYLIFFFYIIGLVLLLKPQEISLNKSFSAFSRVAVFSLAVAASAGFIEFFDSYINNFQKSATIQSIKSDLADDRFLKHRIIETGENPQLMFARDFGISLSDLITRHGWLESSTRSLLGTYGYMRFWSSEIYYMTSAFFGFGLVFLLVIVMAFKSSIQYKLVVTYSFLFLVAVFAQSLAYSWTFNFQPQGRYLLAIIPVIAVTMSLISKKIPLIIIYIMIAIIYLINNTGYFNYGVIPMLSLN